jgi:hypothetical protein
MTIQERPRANVPALPVLSEEDRATIRDDLVLALDLVESGPLDSMGVRHLVGCLRGALRLSMSRTTELHPTP